MITQSQKYFDYYILGGINSHGEVKSVFDQAAIENAILMWLTSSQGEYIGRPSYGGYLITHLNKPMTTLRTRQIQIAITQGLQNDFFPELVIQTVDVIPDFVKRNYYIRVQGYCPSLNLPFQVEEKFRNFSS
jgi:phage baseplate assembly protein W